MGRYDHKRPVAKKGGGKAAARRGKSAPTYTAAMLVERAETLVEQLQPDAALEFYRRALSLAPDDTSVMDAAAEVAFELGDEATARQLFERSVALAPEASAAKWMYLAQMQDGMEARGSYERGVVIMRREERDLAAALSGSAAAAAAAAEGGAGVDAIMGDVCGQRADLAAQLRLVQRHIASALCSISELFMTDLCMEDGAEQECEKYLQEAVAVDSTGAEPLQALANMRVSQGRNADAVECMTRVAHILEELEDEELPPPTFRVVTAKLLIELAMDADAVNVLDCLLAEDDTNVEVLYLYGFALKNSGELLTAREALAKASELMSAQRAATRSSEERAVLDSHMKQITDAQQAVDAALAMAGDSATSGGASDDDDEDDAIDEGGAVDDVVTTRTVDAGVGGAKPPVRGRLSRRTGL